MLQLVIGVYLQEAIYQMHTQLVACTLSYSGTNLFIFCRQGCFRINVIS